VILILGKVKAGNLLWMKQMPQHTALSWSLLNFTRLYL